MPLFLVRYWKGIALAIAIATAWISFGIWKDNLRDTARAEGFAAAEKQYTAAVNAANERERQTQANLDKMVVAFNGLASLREQQINLTLKPMTERITNEVATDPRYSACSVSDGVLIDLNAGRSAVNASIAPVAPR